MPTFGPQLAALDVVQVTSWCQTSDQAGLNVFHYQVKTVNAGATQALSVIANGLALNNHGGALRACLSSAATFYGTITRIIRPTLSLAYTDSQDAGVGLVIGDLLPRQVAGFIRKLSSLPGRGRSGRIYVPFPGEGDNDATSLPSADYMLRLGALRVAMLSQITWGAAGLALPVIVTRASPGPPPVLFAATDVSDMRTFQKWATQRRRGSFGRVNANPFA